MKLLSNSKHQRLIFILPLLLISLGGLYAWSRYQSYKYSSENWNTYVSTKGKFSFKYPDTKMYVSEFDGLELHAYQLPPNEIVPLNIQIQYTSINTELTNAATVLKNCKINKRRKLITSDATFGIYENAKCGDNFDTEIDIHANNKMIYMISIPDAIDENFLNRFLSTFTFYTQLPQYLSSVSPTPALPFPERILPATDLRSQWRIYENEKFGFSLSYPDNWKVKEMFSGEYIFNIVRIAGLQGAEGDIQIFHTTDNKPVECTPGVYNFDRSEKWTPLQLSDQKITACQSNNGLRWKWIFYKDLPKGKLRIVGGTSILRQQNRPEYIQNDKDIILRIFSTLKFIR